MNSFDSSSAHVVYASDDRFASVLGISLLSLYHNSKEMKNITIYILDNNISQENKTKIESVSKQYKRKTPIWIKANNINETLSLQASLDRGSIAQYARLFLSEAIPSDVYRVLYLDCDTVIIKSIKELWNVDLQGKTIGALKEAFSIYYRKNIELNKYDLMFNSGVMLIDLDKWRENKIEDKIKEFILRNRGQIQQGDQGALNAVLSQDTYVIDPKFNVQTYYLDFSYEEILKYRKPKDFYTKNDILKATEMPFIIHFTTSFSNVRPWYKECTHKYKDEWLKYKNSSPWSDEPLIEGNNRFVKVADIIPRRIIISLVGFIHAYIRPIKHSIVTGRVI